MNEYTYADWKPNIQERPVMTRYEADQAILIDLVETFVETRKGRSWYQVKLDTFPPD